MTDFEEIELALAVKERELQKQEAQLKSERELLEQQKQALLLLKPLRGGTGPTFQSSNGAKVGSSQETPLSIRAAISEALSAIPDDTAFSSRDIYERMRTMCLSFNLERNRSNISTYLRQFAAGGEIQIREGGQGQTPHLYGKK
jgi:hypothetical protein